MMFKFLNKILIDQFGGFVTLGSLVSAVAEKSVHPRCHTKSECRLPMRNIPSSAGLHHRQGSGGNEQPLRLALRQRWHVR